MVCRRIEPDQPEQQLPRPTFAGVVSRWRRSCLSPSVTGIPELYVMNANGSGQTRLTDSGVRFRPELDTRLACIFWSGGDGFVHSPEPDGTDEQVLTVAGP